MNPLQIIQLLRSNPQSFIQQMVGNSQIANNPIAMNALELMKNGDNESLKQMAENLCRENGTTPEAVQQGIMSQLGIR